MQPLLPSSMDAVVHLIQVALTPIFLLSGIAALLNVYAGRLAKVADRLDHLSADLRESACSPEQSSEIAALHRRSVLLDLSVATGTVAATATCLSILTLFFLGLSAVQIGGALLLFFGAAIICTLASVVLFGFEMLLGSSMLRVRMRLHVADLPLPWHRSRKA